ncbi:MAG: FtsX-like permease family protein [Actinomycetota bacterium]
MRDWRVLLRLARRNASTAKARSALVVGLIALTVGAGVFAAATMRTFGVTDEDRADAALGGADLSLTVASRASVSAEQTVERILAIADERGDQVSIYEVVDTPAPGVGRLQTIDLADPLTDGVLDLRAGRAPERPGEVALSSASLRVLDARVGDEVALAFTGRMWDVVGEVEHPYERDHEAAVVTAEALDATGFGGRFTVLVAGDGVADGWGDYSGLPGVGVESGRFLAFYDDPGIDFSDPAQLSTWVSLLLVLETAAVAAAAFAVGTRRRLREFGQLAVIGATGRQLRRLVLVESVVLAGVGAVVGVAAGLGTFVVASDRLAAIANHTPVALDWSPLDLIGPFVAGTLAALLAAWWPARRVERIEPVRALTGRFDPARFSPRLAALGLAVTMLGFVAFAVLTGSDISGDVVPIAIVASLVLVFVGTVICSGPLVTMLGQAARPVSGLARLVVRDSGRQPVRAGASIAALLILFAIPVVIATIVRSDDDIGRTPNWTSGRMVVVNDLAESGGGGDHLPNREELIETSTAVELDALTTDALADHSSPSRSGALRIATTTVSVRNVGMSVSATSGAFVGPGVVGIADAETMDLLGFDAEARDVLAAGGAVGGNLFRVRSASLASDGSSAPVEAVAFGDRRIPIDAWLPEGRNGYPLPAVWISPDVAVDLELTVATAGHIVVLDSPLGDDQRRRVQTALAGDLFDRGVEPTDAVALSRWAFDVGAEPQGLANAEVVSLALLGAMMLALLVAGAGAALSAVELDRELGTMVAIGAPPSIRRRFIGLQSGYHAALAAVLATPLAITLVWVVFRSVEPVQDVDLHRPALAAVLVGIPLVVAVAMAALFRSGRPSVSRRLS